MMIIDDFDIERFLRLVRPLETDAPLTIDANAVLPFSITLNGLEVIAGRRSQVDQASGSIEVIECFGSGPVWYSLKLANVFTLCKPL
jgi:hypothetical protein